LFDSNSLPGNSYYVIRTQDIHDNLSPVSNEVVVTISDVDKLNSNIPADYALYQNHPNPFNSLTTICYAIPTTSYITLKIFNLLGKEIATLVNGKQFAGEYEVQWNSVDLPSGVYVYRLETGNFVATKKLILMK